MDIRSWTLNTMLAAAEAQMDASAKDDKERRSNHQKLYAPPREVVRRDRVQGVRRAGMSPDAMRSVLSQVAAEDARIGQARHG